MRRIVQWIKSSCRLKAQRLGSNWVSKLITPRFQLLFLTPSHITPELDDPTTIVSKSINPFLIPVVRIKVKLTWEEFGTIASVKIKALIAKTFTKHNEITYKLLNTFRFEQK